MFNRLARFVKFLFKTKRRGINSEKKQRSTTPKAYTSRKFIYYKGEKLYEMTTEEFADFFR